MTKNSVKDNYQPFSKTNSKSPNHQNINHSINSRNLTNYQLMPAADQDTFWNRNLQNEQANAQAQRIAEQQSQLSRSGYRCDYSGSIPLCYNQQPNWMGGENESIGQAEQQYLFSRN